MLWLIQILNFFNTEEFDEGTSMKKKIYKIIVPMFFLLSVTNICASTIAYNTFLEQPQRFNQVPGFGYYGGAQVTTNIFGNSFTPTASGTISEIWVAVGSNLAAVGSDIFNVILAEAGAQDEPSAELARFTITGELSKRESIVSIAALDRGVFINEGIRYWMLISPGPGTSEVGWLGGPPNSVPGQLSAYPDSSSSTGRFVADFNVNGAMRIDVTAVPLPATVWLLLSGIIGLFSFCRSRVKNFQSDSGLG
ncbi:MAG: hypothetical protein HY081_08540 [Gammaproteobacteria bacterium]|nr:hypothetical protein [Gammaproteobacteria bacterium]